MKRKNQELSIWEKKDAEEEKEVVGGGVEENKMKGRVNRETMQLPLREPNQAIMLGRLSLSNLEKNNNPKTTTEKPDGIPHSGGKSGLCQGTQVTKWPPASKATARTITHSSSLFVFFVTIYSAVINYYT